VDRFFEDTLLSVDGIMVARVIWGLSCRCRMCRRSSKRPGAQVPRGCQAVIVRADAGNRWSESRARPTRAEVSDVATAIMKGRMP